MVEKKKEEIKMGISNYIMSILPLSFIDTSFIPETPSAFQKFLIAIITMNLITLWTFVGIMGQMFTLYIINYTKLEEKYPRIKRMVDYYKNTSYVFLIIDVILFILSYIIIIGICVRFLFLSN